MKTVIIIRKKSFVAKLSSVKIYVSDANKPETEINCIPCRKIGEIENGGELKVELPSSECTLFAVYDEVSKNSCGDSIYLPEGDGKILITGKSKFAPMRGNPFVFDK